MFLGVRSVHNEPEVADVEGFLHPRANVPCAIGNASDLRPLGPSLHARQREQIVEGGVQFGRRSQRVQPVDLARLLHQPHLDLLPPAHPAPLHEAADAAPLGLGAALHLDRLEDGHRDHPAVELDLQLLGPLGCVDALRGYRVDASLTRG